LAKSKSIRGSSKVNVIVLSSMISTSAPRKLCDAGQGRIRAGVQRVAVRHVSGGHGAPVEMNSASRVDVEGPLGEVVVHLPALGEAGIVIGAR
jgi:hypothetical protein